MNRSTPINVSGLSSAIVNTVPNDHEESFTKCKTNKDNHSPRPAHTRYSDLFDQPCSGAQIIIFLTSEPKSFLNLKITEKLTFMNSLTKINGQVKGRAPSGPTKDTSTHTHDHQRKRVLDLKVVKEFHITCKLSS
jgi:hypothetical protein